MKNEQTEFSKERRKKKGAGVEKNSVWS